MKLDSNGLIVSKACSVNGCDLEYSCKGYCSIHYNRNRRHGSPLVEPPIKKTKQERLELRRIVIKKYKQSKKGIISELKYKRGLGFTTKKKHVAKRRLALKNATPPWVNKKKIRLIYKTAFYLGKFVDHIVPINNKNVCGLHVHNNLKLTSPRYNLKKGNSFYVA